MAINLSNVNISLDEFQKISSGWFNAGEVRLKDENTDFVNSLCELEGVESAVLVSYNGDYMG